MALIFQGCTCSICDRIIEEEQEIVAWPAFLNEDHTLWKYSDSAMHKRCFDQWNKKDEFIRLYKTRIDLNDPYLVEMIEKQGIPEWLKNEIHTSK
ncbi:hypothetical protein GYB22_12080 [bacterium]|nr:hypothetical protein [bacterium]